MCPVIGLERGDEFAIRRLPMNVCVEIGKRSSECMVKTPSSGLVGSTIRLRCVVHEIVGEKFLEDLEIPTALHFFSIAADDGLAASDDMTRSFQWLDFRPSDVACGITGDPAPSWRS